MPGAGAGWRRLDGRGTRGRRTRDHAGGDGRSRGRRGGTEGPRAGSGARRGGSRLPGVPAAGVDGSARRRSPGPPRRAGHRDGLGGCARRGAAVLRVRLRPDANEQAVVGALGELAETVLLTARLRRTAAAPGQLRRAAPRSAGPTASWTRSRWCCPRAPTPTPTARWTGCPTTRWSTGEQVLAPAELVACRGADLPGATPARWLAHHAGHQRSRRRGHRGTRAGPRAAGAGPAGRQHRVLPGARAGRADRHRRAAGRRDRPRCWARFTPPASLPRCAWPRPSSPRSSHVTGVDTDPDTPPLAVSGCGEGAHPDPEVAIAKAVQEYAASRVRKVFAHGPLGPGARAGPGLPGARARPAAAAAGAPRARGHGRLGRDVGTGADRAALLRGCWPKSSTVDFGRAAGDARRACRTRRPGAAR